MPRLNLIAIAACLGPLLTPPARAEPPRVALIIGDASYAAMPAIPGCAKSANTVAAALRGLGFDLIERQDASTGGVDAGLIELSQRLTGGGTAVVYVCGYATDFNNRTFVLPTTARLTRPSDVMTQGLLAKSLVSAATHDPATVAVVVFDLVAAPDGPSKLDIDAMTALPVPDGVAIIAATETKPADAPTPLAVALAAALAGPRVGTEDLMDSVRAKLASNTMVIAAEHAPVRPGFLAGAPAPVAPAPPPPPPPAAAAPQVAPAPVAAAVTVPQERLPDEAQMTDPERRKVQTALIRLGYYDNPVDGLFGPETRAAIRRYQHEIGSQTTGHLTAEQASRLVSSH